MDHSILQLMLFSGILLLVSVFASKTSTRYGIPILFVFIVLGMLTGGEGFFGLRFDSPHVTHILGTVALIYILFSGGLSTDPQVVKPIWKEGVTLASVGVLISTGIMSVLIHYTMNWSWITSALLSATVSSTDASAVFGILKTQKLSLGPKLEALIELESGSNDPMAVFITLSLIHVIQRPLDFTWGQIFINFFIQMSFGGLAGWFLGKALVLMINWLDLELEGLYPVFTLAGVICIYSLTEFCGGNGFLSVYIAGLAMAGERFFNKKSLIVFHDGIAWLMQVAMFLTLGILVTPSDLMPVASLGIFLSLGLALVARPLATLLCLRCYKYHFREIMFVSWGGLRGAVPIILATYLLVSRTPDAKTMFNLVFFIVILSMLVQGTTLGPVSRWLGVQEKNKELTKLPFKSRNPERDFVEFEVRAGSPLLGKNLLELHWPSQCLVVLIRRGGLDFMPQGNTEIETNDRLVCLIDLKQMNELEKLIYGVKDGSDGQS